MLLKLARRGNLIAETASVFQSYGDVTAIKIVLEAKTKLNVVRKKIFSCPERVINSFIA